MKRIVLFLSVAVIMTLGLASCGSSGEPADGGFSDIDVDLTKMSATMVYSEVYDMMYTPENYVGKTVKMKGQCAAYQDPNTGNDYYACIIQDATACCSQGLEFDLDESYEFPADYPIDGKEVTVTGVFTTYDEEGETYCTLKDAQYQ
ncbi:MAG: hypothetical protein IJV66_05300 [Firmicutes bacterium]|nr:hypothetical protein [Bacillota bacterium]